MDGRIRWGILGPGAISQRFATALKAVPDADLIAVGSRNRQRANAFADTFDIPHRHANYTDLTQDPDVDVIYVATPHPFHEECAIRCLDAGKAVLCEKPLTVDATQATALIAAARRNRRFLMEAMWTRFLPAIVQVREWLAEGAIGEPRLLTAAHGSRKRKTPAVLEGRLFTPALGGGALLDVGVYTVSLAHTVFGTPTQITSLAHLGSTGVDEQASLLLGYDSGAIASLFCAISTDVTKEARIIGTDGYIHIPEVWQATTATLVRSGKAPIEIQKPFRNNGYEYQAMAVHRCLRAGELECDVMPLDESLAIMETMDTLRAQWGLTYPPVGSVFQTP